MNSKTYSERTFVSLKKYLHSFLGMKGEFEFLKLSFLSNIVIKLEYQRHVVAISFCTIPFSILHAESRNDWQWSNDLCLSLYLSTSRNPSSARPFVCLSISQSNTTHSTPPPPPPPQHTHTHPHPSIHVDMCILSVCSGIWWSDFTIIIIYMQFCF